MHLTTDQIQYIEEFIDNSGINYSHLKEDLLDHICCDVEKHMEHRKSFKTAFEQVLFNCSMSHLAHLQKQTLLLTNKIYAFMKKIVHLFGVVVPVLITIGAMGKVYQWPGAVLCLVFGFLFLNSMLIPAITVVSYIEFNDRKYYWPHVTGAASLIVLLTSLLFKIMHWPGANILQIAGLFTLVLIIPVFLKGFRNSLKTSGPILLVVLSIMLLVVGVIMKMFHWPGAITVIVISLVTLNGILLPGFLLSKQCNPAKSLMAVVLAVWLSIGGLISFNKFSTSAKEYYTHQSSQIQFSNRMYEKLLSDMPKDSFQMTSIVKYYDAYSNLNGYLREKINSNGELVEHDQDFKERFKTFNKSSEALLVDVAGLHDYNRPEIIQPFSAIRLCESLEIIHQQQLIQTITNLKK